MPTYDRTDANDSEWSFEVGIPKSESDSQNIVRSLSNWSTHKIYLIQKESPSDAQLQYRTISYYWKDWDYWQAMKKEGKG